MNLDMSTARTSSLFGRSPTASWNVCPLSFPKISSGQIRVMRQNWRIIRRDACDLPSTLDGCDHSFKSQRRLELENFFLRHQLNIALRRAPHRLRFRCSDRALMVSLTRLSPGLIGLARVVQPETILRWHRAGFRAYWLWKSRGQPGRPKIGCGLRDLFGG